MSKTEGLVEAGFKPREKTYELKTLEGGWVTLRRMTHGQSNELTDQRLSFIPGDDDEDGKTTSGKAKVSTKLGRHFSFSHCVIDHNLSNNGKKFDFTKRRDVDDLDPVIGDEIAQKIDDHNDALKEEDIPN